AGVLLSERRDVGVRGGDSAADSVPVRERRVTVPAQRPVALADGDRHVVHGGPQIILTACERERPGLNPGETIRLLLERRVSRRRGTAAGSFGCGVLVCGGRGSFALGDRIGGRFVAS